LRRPFCKEIQYSTRPQPELSIDACLFSGASLRNRLRRFLRAGPSAPIFVRPHRARPKDFRCSPSREEREVFLYR